jgi:hypothetical protein
MRVKNLAAPVEVEPPRSGEDAADCVACNTPDDAYIWVSERWRVRGMDRPTGLPIVLILECRSHLDIGDLPNLLAAELGVMTVRLERAIRSLDGVARVHVNRWGDGSAHLHMWFLARPYGRLQLRGTFLSLWDDILPVIPEEQWLENLALVAAWLGEFGGRAIAEPPHIHWQSPSTFSNEPTAGPDSPDFTGAWSPTEVADSDSDRAPSDSSGRAEAADADGPATEDLSELAARAAGMADAAQSAAGLSIPEPRDDSGTPNAAAASGSDGQGLVADERNVEDEATADFGSAGSGSNESSGDSGRDGVARTGAVATTPTGADSQAITRGAIPLQYRPTDADAAIESDGGEQGAAPEGAALITEKSTATIARETR